MPFATNTEEQDGLGAWRKMSKGYDPTMKGGNIKGHWKIPHGQEKVTDIVELPLTAEAWEQQVKEYQKKNSKVVNTDDKNGGLDRGGASSCPRSRVPQCRRC